MKNLSMTYLGRELVISSPPTSSPTVDGELTDHEADYGHVVGEGLCTFA